MTPEQFCYWLQGFNEVAGAQPTPEQWVVIKDHLKTVFDKRTPDRTGSVPGNTDKGLGPDIVNVPFVYPREQEKLPWKAPYEVICSATGSAGDHNASAGHGYGGGAC